MSNNKYEKNMQYAVYALEEAMNRIAGQHSNIPECCIETYINGRTYIDFENTLNSSEKEKLNKWNYVPCDHCFRTGNISKLKYNGLSDVGEILFSIIKIIERKEKTNERKCNKRSKK